MFQDYSLVIAIAIFFVFVLASRTIIMNALKKLTDDDKEKLLSTRTINQSPTRMLLLIGGLGIYYFAIVKYKEYMREIVIGFMLVIIASRVFSFISTRKKLINAELPDDYVRAYMNSSMLYTVGILLFFFLMMKNLL